MFDKYFTSLYGDGEAIFKTLAQVGRTLKTLTDGTALQNTLRDMVYNPLGPTGADGKGSADADHSVLFHGIFIFIFIFMIGQQHSLQENLPHRLQKDQKPDEIVAYLVNEKIATKNKSVAKIVNALCQGYKK